MKVEPTDDPVCYCGERFSAHNWMSNHSPVEMPESQPPTPPLTDKELEDLEAQWRTIRDSKPPEVSYKEWVNNMWILCTYLPRLLMMIQRLKQGTQLRREPDKPKE